MLHMEVKSQVFGLKQDLVKVSNWPKHRLKTP